MNQTELAYTAGIVDGEGCLGIYLANNGENYKPTYYAIVTVVNTDKCLLQWLEKSYGGRVFQVRHKEEGKNWKPIWRWEIRTSEALQFLTAIYPFLFIKKAQADVLISFLEMEGGGRLSGGSRVIAEAQRILMKSLNKRGVTEEISPLLK